MYQKMFTSKIVSSLSLKIFLLIESSKKSKSILYPVDSIITSKSSVVPSSKVTVEPEII